CPADPHALPSFPPRRSSDLPVALRSPYPELGRFQEVDGSGKANYNSFSAKLQRRFSKGLTYMFGYTWSKSIDYGSAIRVHDTDRSEEHTSELQSRFDLVCRL